MSEPSADETYALATPAGLIGKGTKAQATKFTLNPDGYLTRYQDGQYGKLHHIYICTVDANDKVYILNRNDFWRLAFTPYSFSGSGSSARYFLKCSVPPPDNTINCVVNILPPSSLTEFAFDSAYLGLGSQATVSNNPAYTIVTPIAEYV